MSKKELDNIIILNDELGNEVQFEFLELIEYMNDEYVVLLPVEDDDYDEGAGVTILKVDGSDDKNESYISVEDDDTLKTVFEIFKDKFKEEFNFLDE